MRTASFRFYAGLNDFLHTGLRNRAFLHAFQADQSVKHLIESLGVPHAEVEMILVNGESVCFAQRVQHGDRVSVYPHFETLDITGISLIRPLDTRPTAFVLDNHLGKLATYLRMLGLDTLYRNDFQDEILAQLSNHENRILLTRDQDLLKRRLVTHGYWVREKTPHRQVIEILKRFDLADKLNPFTRCLRCNGLLEPVPKDAILDRLEPKTRLYYDRFARCPVCDQIFWQGSHWERMQQMIDTLWPEALND
jgi:uncharacterized protein with PIN domain